MLKFDIFGAPKELIEFISELILPENDVRNINDPVFMWSAYLIKVKTICVLLLPELETIKNTHE